MFSIGKSCKRLNVEPPEKLRFVGFGIRHKRSGIEQIIPNIYNSTPHYSLIFNHESLKINVDGTIRYLPANTLVIWDQSCHVLYGARGSRWSISWIQFYGEDAIRLIRKNKIPLNEPVPFNSERIINHYWIPLFEESCEYVKPDSAVIMNFINGILLEVNRELRNRKGKHPGSERRIPEVFQKIHSFINANYLNRITLSELAERANIAPVYLSRKFKEYFGIAPIDYIITLRLNDAALYLRNPDLNIQEVAAKVGYNEYFHFSKLFKKHLGSSPKNYRDNLFGANAGR